MSDFNQPPPPPPPPPGAGPSPVPGMGGGTQKNSLGTWALVLGIVSIVCCGFIAGIPAIFIGRASEKAQAEGLATNGNLGKVGFILGIIGSVLGLLGIVLSLSGALSFDTTF